MMQMSRIATALAGLLVNGFVALNLTGSAQAQSAASSAITFPMVGLAFGQTLQINVITFNRCDLQISLFDGEGGTVASGEFPQESFSFNYTYLKFQDTRQEGRPRRKEFRADVTLQPTTEEPCSAQATAEVYDTETRAATVLVAGLIPPEKQFRPGRPTFGPIGLTERQVARINVVAHPPNPCFGIMSFVDTLGRPLGGQGQAMLAPGQATFLDLPGRAAVPDERLRREVIGVFTPAPGVAPDACIASLEVFDHRDGVTRVLMPPGPPVLPAETITLPPG